MKLNLGCCDCHAPGYVNVDRRHPADEIADLSIAPWPWKNSSAEEILAYDIIEHLPDKIQTMNEIWRVLTPGGRADIAVPTTDGPGAFQDPTHVSFWNRNSFKYFDAASGYRRRFAEHYGILASFNIISSFISDSDDGARLRIILEAVK